MGKRLIIQGADFSAYSLGSSQISNRVYISVASNPADGGSVTGGGYYNTGQSATLIATPASGYTFSRWSDGITTASRTIVVGSSNMSYTANFSIDGEEESTELTWESVDISSLDRYVGVLNNQNKWYFNSNNQLHIKIDVTSGEHLKISAYANDGKSDHEDWGIYYAFLTSSHTEPVTNGSVPKLATDAACTRISKSDGEVEIVAPSDAAYFVIGVTDGTPIPFAVTIKRGIPS